MENDRGTTARLAAIQRYPVKGLSAQPLARTRLTPGETLPGDRAYAIENGPSGFDPFAPAHLPKQWFLMLARNAALAAFAVDFDEATGTLVIHLEGREVARGALTTPDGRAAVETFFADAFAAELRGPPRIVAAAGHSFSDVPAKVVSILNLATVAAIEAALGAPLDPLRFRANLHVDGWPSWHEFDLIGRTLAIGGARLRVLERIERCAAIEVEPGSGRRDPAILRTLNRTFDHCDCGVYAEVVAAGEVAIGDMIEEA